MYIQKLDLQSLTSENQPVAEAGWSVHFPVYEGQGDPESAEAELWLDGSKMHVIPMARMTASLNGIMVYAPISAHTRSSPGSAFEHTVNSAVNSVVVLGDGPVDPEWSPA